MRVNNIASFRDGDAEFKKEQLALATAKTRFVVTSTSSSLSNQTLRSSTGTTINNGRMTSLIPIVPTDETGSASKLSDFKAVDPVVWYVGIGVNIMYFLIVKLIEPDYK